MQSAQVTADLNEANPTDICNYIEQVYFPSIRRSVKMVENYIENNLYIKNNINKNKYINLFCSIFPQLEDAVEQLINKDIIVFFPLIRNDKGAKPCTARKLPLQDAVTIHQTIMDLLLKIQQEVGNFFLLEPSCDEWPHVERKLQQVIHLKEHILFRKIEKLFNQKCSGACKLKPVEAHSH